MREVLGFPYSMQMVACKWMLDGMLTSFVWHGVGDLGVLFDSPKNTGRDILYFGMMLRNELPICVAEKIFEVLI